ncbi:proto-oncogene c-Rel [Patella vulgata]|uniref:proto-oncogene c-Rel n=1 Tax=Patella vulgata TaxID=6465 RepID=UPI0024A9988A|nr:proto-oncogene c-Rel [Patella vulgata]
MADEKKIFIELGRDCRYQKFRYPTEKRTGKKQHANKLMTITLKNIQESDVEDKMKVSIFCVTDDQEHRLHPNTLLGKNCQKGFYQSASKTNIDKNSERDYKFDIPYLYILRTKNNEKMKTLSETAKLLPETFKSSFVDDKNFYKEIKTDSVCLRVVVEFGDTVLSELSERITHHDGGEKVKLNIIKVTQYSFEAASGGDVDLFTEDKIGPNITPGDYEVRVKTNKWESEWKSLTSEDILYKRVVNYKVPPYNNQERISEDVTGEIELKCLKNGTSCQIDIIYRPCHADRKRKMLPYPDNPAACKKPRIGTIFLFLLFIDQPYTTKNDEALSSVNKTIILFEAQDKEATVEDGQTYLVNNGGRNFRHGAEEQTHARSHITESEQMDTSVQLPNIPSLTDIDKEKYPSMEPPNEHQQETQRMEEISMQNQVCLNSTDLSMIDC